MSTTPLVAASRTFEGPFEGRLDAPSSAGMSLLSNGVPLSLLMDLVFGPHSEEVFAQELAEQRPPAA